MDCFSFTGVHWIQYTGEHDCSPNGSIKCSEEAKKDQTGNVEHWFSKKGLNELKTRKWKNTSRTGATSITARDALIGRGWGGVTQGLNTAPPLTAKVGVLIVCHSNLR